MEKVLLAQMELLRLDRYQGKLEEKGFRRALTLPSGKVVFLEGRGDVPGLPGHWQRGKLRYEAQGLWAEDDDCACVYRTLENQFWVVEKWTPFAESDPEAAPISFEEGFAWVRPLLLDYERAVVESMGLDHRICQLKGAPCALCIQPDFVSDWVMHLGSHLIEHASFSAPR